MGWVGPRGSGRYPRLGRLQGCFWPLVLVFLVLMSVCVLMSSGHPDHQRRGQRRTSERTPLLFLPGSVGCRQPELHPARQQRFLFCSSSCHFCCCPFISLSSAFTPVGHHLISSPRLIPPQNLPVSVLVLRWWTLVLHPFLHLLPVTKADK